MANVTINELPANTEVALTDAIPTSKSDNSGVKTTVSQIVEVAKMQEYSTEEKVVGKWIDGKLLYRKVIQATSPTTLNSATDIGEVTSNIDKLVSLGGMLISTTGNFVPLNSYISASDYTTAYFNKNSKKVRMRVGYSTYLNTDVFLILEYTKTEVATLSDE